MKRVFILFALVCLHNIAALGQKKYEMVIEKTNGTEVVINTEDIVRTYFRERTNEVPPGITNPDGNDFQLPANLTAVDLDLPSGLKWANMNLGATSSTDYGLYFAWGETKGYGSSTSDGHSFDWYSYIFGDDAWAPAKYNRNDNKKVLDLEDDAAHVNWGGSWRMPTIEEVRELVENTSAAYVSINGVNGMRFTSSKNGNSIFLPAAGDRFETGLEDMGSDGIYWTSSIGGEGTRDAFFMYFNMAKVTTHGYDDRIYGRVIRAVSQ